MIILIDDTPLEKFDAEFILNEPYSRFIYLITNEEEFENKLSDIHLSNCVMVHRTFCNSVKTKDIVSELTDDGGKIPLVIFSAGDAPIAEYNSNEPNWIGGIGKATFYFRIRDFLEKYIDKNIVDLSLIAYGAQKSYQEIRPICIKILNELGICETNKNGVRNVIESADFELFIQNANPAIKISTDQILSEYSNSKITLSDIKNNVLNVLGSFEKYGKNIYSWK